MKIMKSKFITKRVLIFIIFTFIFFFAVSKTTNKKPRSIQKTNPAPIPSIEQKYKGNFDITLSFKKEMFNFPSKLPLLEIEKTPPLDKNFSQKVAENLGFSSNVNEIDDSIDGKVYFWKNNEATLFIYSRTKTIRCHSNKSKNVVDKQLSEKDILSIANDFINKSEILGKDSFKLGGVKFLKEINTENLDGGYKETEKEDASFYQVNILPKQAEYDILTKDSVESSSYITMTKDGSVESLQITIFPKLNKSLTEYKIKNYDELKSELNKSVLIELRGNNYILSELPKNFIQKVEIKKIEISYLIESPTKTYLIPVFKLTGEAFISNKEEAVATMYLPAFSQQN